MRADSLNDEIISSEHRESIHALLIDFEDKYCVQRVPFAAMIADEKISSVVIMIEESLHTLLKRGFNMI